MGNLAFAETKVFIEDYTYQASEADSKLSSRVIALEQAKRLLLEKLGTYLEDETEVKNFQLTKDQIVTFTAGIVSAEIVNERWDGKTYYLKTKITADPQEIIKSIDLLRQDRQKTKELEEARKKADEALREVERLKKELETAKAEKPDFSRYNIAVNGLRAAVGEVDLAKAHLEAQKDRWNKEVGLTAEDWRKRGHEASGHWRHEEAIEAYTRAIELDPKDFWSYDSRGMTYVSIAESECAALRKRPGTECKSVKAFYHYHQAIADYDKAIELTPNEYRIASKKFLPVIYLRRARVYNSLGDDKHMIEDYKTAVRVGADEHDVKSFEFDLKFFRDWEKANKSLYESK
jgi:tetratricopeptide (TPR) repeat protein